MKHANYVPDARPAGMVVRVAAAAWPLSFGERSLPVPDECDPIGCCVVDGQLVPIQGFRADQTYAELRREEYPPITDYLDGIVKGDQAQVERYIARCRAVKNKYPKPEGAQ